MLSEAIDARQFNTGFPKIFPRYIQHAIWSYSAGEGLSAAIPREAQPYYTWRAPFSLLGH